MLGIFRRNHTRPVIGDGPKAATQKITIRSQSQPVTEQTIDYLKGADPDDILELMLPALVQEQQKRLGSTASELEVIDQKLAKLYASRDDIYSVMAANQSNGVAD